MTYPQSIERLLDAAFAYYREPYPQPRHWHALRDAEATALAAGAPPEVVGMAIDQAKATRPPV